MALNAEPPEPVRTIEELFAVAYAMEQRAARRYMELAAEMRKDGDTKTAAVFDQLMREEREHCEQVTRLCKQRIGTLPDVAKLRWHVPESPDEEALQELAGSRLATPYRALSIAVRNEERAFSFWTYVAAQARDPAVHETAELMARDELDHIATLRRERRRVYHAARPADREKPALRKRSATEALAQAADLERVLAGRLRQLAAGNGGAQDRIRELARDTQALADELVAQKFGETHPPQQQPVPSEIVPLAEFLLECYLDAAERATDEAVLMLAQGLASKAVARLAQLRTLNGRLHEAMLIPPA